MPRRQSSKDELITDLRIRVYSIFIFFGCDLQSHWSVYSQLSTIPGNLCVMHWFMAAAHVVCIPTDFVGCHTTRALGDPPFAVSLPLPNMVASGAKFPATVDWPTKLSVS